VKDFALHVGVPPTIAAAPRFPGELFATTVNVLSINGYTGSVALSLGPTAPSDPFVAASTVFVPNPASIPSFSTGSFSSKTTRH